MSNEYTIIEKIKNLFARPEAEVSDLELMNQLTEAGVEIPAAATREILTDLLNAELSKRENTPTQTDSDKTEADVRTEENERLRNLATEKGVNLFEGKEYTDEELKGAIEDADKINSENSSDEEEEDCDFCKDLPERKKLLAKMIIDGVEDQAEFDKQNFGKIQVMEMKAKIEGKDCGCN